MLVFHYIYTILLYIEIEYDMICWIMEQNWLLPEHGGKELDDKMIALDGTPNKSGLAFLFGGFCNL